MKYLAQRNTILCATTLLSLTWLYSPVPAQADVVTEAWFLELTGKEWCRDDPKYSEALKVKKTDSVVFSVTRDTVSGEAQATINTNGQNLTVDSTTLSGRLFLSSPTGSSAELVLTGRDSGNPNHFLTLRGKATIDKTGKITKISGTYVYQTLSDLGEVQDVDCFGDGKFGTQGFSTTGIGGGTLTVTNGPPEIKGKFDADPMGTTVFVDQQGSGIVLIGWAEKGSNATHGESMSVGGNVGGALGAVLFSDLNPTAGTFVLWGCEGQLLAATCNGVTLNKDAGFIQFKDTVLKDQLGSAPDITLNGILTFKPY